MADRDRYKSEESRARALANLRGQPPAPEEGNERARRHGGYGQVSAEQRSEREREVLDALAESAPLRAPGGGLPPADELAVSLLAESLVRRERVSRWIADYGPLDEKTGDVKAAVFLEGRLRREAFGYAEALGMTPASRAKLGLDLVRSIDLAQAMSEPDPVMRRQLLERAGVLDPEEGDGA